jgi:hypothetical protein
MTRSTSAGRSTGGTRSGTNRQAGSRAATARTSSSIRTAHARQLFHRRELFTKKLLERDRPQLGAHTCLVAPLIMRVDGREQGIERLLDPADLGFLFLAAADIVSS